MIVGQRMVTRNDNQQTPHPIAQPSILNLLSLNPNPPNGGRHWLSY